MLLSLDSGVSALENFQQQLNVIANNVANVNTVGFKSAYVSFADTLSETLGSNAAGSVQIGTGMTTATITNNFSTPGSLASTGVTTNLAIEGNGFFVVKDATSGNSYVTQDGNFSLDSNGYLVTSSGLRVQGASGDIQFPTSNSTPSMTGYQFNKNGTITVNLADGTTTTPTGGAIALQNFSNPAQLVKAGGNLYSVTTAAGGLATPGAPGSNGLGTIVSGYLEMSNVDLAHELTSLITTQRAYEANSKVISTSDEVLQTLVNLKR
jgi:flagellar hook protein FlgE